MSCAGITRDEFLLHMSEEDWDRVIAVNLKVVLSKPVTCPAPTWGGAWRKAATAADHATLVTLSCQGTFLVTQAAAQALVSSGGRGSIINISSIVGKVRMRWTRPASHVGAGKQLPCRHP